MKKIIWALVAGLMATGCASFEQRVPSKAINKSDVVYMTSRLSTPKDVVYRSPQSEALVSGRAIPPEIIGIIGNIGTEITDGFFDLRKNVLFSDVEIFIAGTNVDSKVISESFKALKQPIDAAK